MDFWLCIYGYIKSPVSRICLNLWIDIVKGEQSQNDEHN